MCPPTSCSLWAPLSRGSYMRVTHADLCPRVPPPHPILGPTGPQKGPPRPPAIAVPGVSRCTVTPAGGGRWPIACLNLGLQNSTPEPPPAPRPGPCLHHLVEAAPPPPTIQIISLCSDWAAGAGDGGCARDRREGLAVGEGGGMFRTLPCPGCGEVGRCGGRIGERSASQGWDDRRCRGRMRCSGMSEGPWTQEPRRGTLRPRPAFPAQPEPRGPSLREPPLAVSC